MLPFMATNMSKVFCKNCMREKVTWLTYSWSNNVYIITFITTVGTAIFDRDQVMNLNVTGEQIWVGSIIHADNLFAENYTVYILVKVCETRIKSAESILVDIIITRRHPKKFGLSLIL